MLLQNITLFAQYPYRRFGGTATATDGTNVRSQLGINSRTRLTPFVSMAGWSRDSSFPLGWEFGNGWMPPIIEQEVWRANLGRSTIVGAGEIVSSSNLAGGLNGACTITGAGAIVAAAAGLIISAVATLAGSGAITVADLRGRLDAFATLSGSGDVTTATLGAIAGAVATLLGSGTVSTAAASGVASASATITVTGDLLTTGNVGAAVWNALAAASNLPNTMGEKLNDAGSASNPWTEVLESGMTAAEILRVILSGVAGDCEVTDNGNGTYTIAFKSVDGTITRITGTTTSGGIRSGSTLDGST